MTRWCHFHTYNGGTIMEWVITGIMAILLGLNAWAFKRLLRIIDNDLSHIQERLDEVFSDVQKLKLDQAEEN